VWPFLVAFGLLLLPMLFAVFSSVNFEYQRWSESDHPWTTSSSDSDDDSE
jgi:hypothetical protein